MFGRTVQGTQTKTWAVTTLAALNAPHFPKLILNDFHVSQIGPKIRLNLPLDDSESASSPFEYESKSASPNENCRQTVFFFVPFPMWQVASAIDFRNDKRKKNKYLNMQFERKSKRGEITRSEFEGKFIACVYPRWKKPAQYSNIQRENWKPIRRSFMKALNVSRNELSLFFKKKNKMPNPFAHFLWGQLAELAASRICCVSSTDCSNGRPATTHFLVVTSQIRLKMWSPCKLPFTFMKMPSLELKWK